MKKNTKNQYKTLLAVLITTLMIASVFGSRAFIMTKGDIIDQQQTSTAGGCASMSVPGYAQSFKPTLSPLTKVELHMSYAGNPNVDFVVSIRSDLINGDDLTWISKTAAQIGGGMRFGWCATRSLIS